MDEQQTTNARPSRPCRVLLVGDVIGKPGREALEQMATKAKRREIHIGIPESRREDALGALCDAEVTGNGVAYLAGFDKPGADRAVLASNDAKLVGGKPVLLEGGKIGKPADWRAPDLRPFV